MKRHESREQALILLFESTFESNDADEILTLANVVRNEKISNFTKELFKGTLKNLNDIDSYIEKYMIGWKKDRLSKLVLSVLRLAIFEMIYYENTPLDVSINEAIELTKKYATYQDASYVNGILGALSANIEKRG